MQVLFNEAERGDVYLCVSLIMLLCIADSTEKIGYLVQGFQT